MDQHNPVNIDALIEDVLTSERMESVPLNFHRKVGKCVRIATLRQREQARFRVTILLVSLGMIAIMGSGIGVMALTHGTGMRNNGLPGAFGFLDQYSTNFSLYITSINANHLLISSASIAALSFAIGLLSFQRSVRKQG